MTEYPRSSTALLLVDPLNDFIADGGKLWPLMREVAERVRLVPNLKRLLAAAREAGHLVVFVPHQKWRDGMFDGWKFLNPSQRAAQRIKPFALGSWGAQFHAELQPLEGELIAKEHWLHDGFSNTDLDYLLRNHGVDHLVFAGMRANTCIEASARRAVELGYHVTLVKDASAARGIAEWAATMEVNAPAFAHEVLTTNEILPRLSSAQAA